MGRKKPSEEMSVTSVGRPTRERKRRKTARRRSSATPHKPFFEHSARSESISARSRRFLGRLLGANAARAAGAAALAFLLVAAAASAGVSQVRLKLPLKPRLPLRGNEKLALAPFILVTEAEKARDKRLQNVDLQGEFHRFLKKQVDKKTKLEVIETPPDLKLPTQNLTELARATEFWRSVGVTTNADIIVSGSLEFRIEDRSGYKTEEYVSPINGQTYYRQVYVEQTGFLFDIVFLVFDGHTGEKLLQDEFKDFRQTGGRRADELQGLFENLFSLENQILNLFVAREREADRYLFTD